MNFLPDVSFLIFAIRIALTMLRGVDIDATREEFASDRSSSEVRNL